MKDDKENFVLPEGKREPDIKRVEDLLSLLLSEQYHLNIKVTCVPKDKADSPEPDEHKD